MSIIFPAIDDHFLDYISVYVYTSRYYWAFNSIMNVNRFYSLIIAVKIKRVVNFETCIHQGFAIFKFYLYVSWVQKSLKFAWGGDKIY